MQHITSIKAAAPKTPDGGWMGMAADELIEKLMKCSVKIINVYRLTGSTS